MAATMAEKAHEPPKRTPLRPTGMKIEPPPAQPRVDAVRTNSTSMAAVTSPVNQNGSFEFDRVIKAGTVVKRTRKTKVRRQRGARQSYR